MMAGGTGNLLLDGTQALLAEHRLIDKPPNGLGDLTAAVYLARILSGQPAIKALQSTTAAVYEILARTAKRGGDELQLETDAQSLSHPMAMVQLRHLTASGAGPPGVTLGGVVLVGVDGCKAGWIAVRRDPGAAPSVDVFASFAALLAALPADAISRRRHADRPAGIFAARAGADRRRWCGRCLAQRQSSVFSIPSRAALYADTRRLHHGRGLVCRASPGKRGGQDDLRPAARRLDPGLRHLFEDPRDRRAC